jgi:hypothetical protein
MLVFQNGGRAMAMARQPSTAVNSGQLQCSRSDRSSTIRNADQGRCVFNSQARRQDMKRIAIIAIAALALGSFGVSTNTAFATKNDAYAQKKAECKQEAKAKNFGIHFIKRDRWVKNCIAGRHT